MMSDKEDSTNDEQKALAEGDIELPRVRFVCRSSHHQSEVALMDFVRVEAPAGVWWIQKLAGSNTDGHKRIGQFLDGHRRLSKKESRLFQRGLYKVAGDVIRTNYRFQCDVCGATTVIRDDTFARVLEDLVSSEDATFDVGHTEYGPGA